MSFASSCVRSSEPCLCFYINRSQQTQIAKFVNASVPRRDRIIRPNEHLLFEAPPAEILEIYVLASDQPLMLTSLSCRELIVNPELIESMLRWLL
ncbi:MAG: DUF1830 domain-containing protein [Leptolyngbyaceae cyanobacterium bins.302]|nr:DUF1830 domain-containing protein [Leptolyngbyaceae cyanobacterium bins.302]